MGKLIKLPLVRYKSRLGSWLGKSST